MLSESPYSRCRPPGRPRWSALIAAYLCLEACAGLNAQTCDVALLTTPSDLYEQATTPIKDLLTRENLRCEVVKFTPSKDSTNEATTPETSDSRPTVAAAQSETEKAVTRLTELKPKAVVAIGTTATLLALKALPGTPVIFCMVPNIADQRFTEGETGLDRIAGITTDIDPAVQVRWIKRLSPSVKTLGVLHGERTKRTADAIAQAARSQDINVLRVPAKIEQFPAAIAELDAKGCDGVLMVADSDVYNTASVQRLLLWGVRNRKPIWAFSPNLVKAGAFAAVYSEPESLARQVTAMTKKLLAGENPKSLHTQYPEHILSAVNERTAELIGIPLGKDTLDALSTRFGQKK
jgi:ABC-type uncharacterized transport system substrate-binding protein